MVPETQGHVQKYPENEDTLVLPVQKVSTVEPLTLSKDTPEIRTPP